MHLLPTQPLLVRSLCSRMLYEFLPVKAPEPQRFDVFERAVAIRLHEDDAHRVRMYLARHAAGAVSEQGEVAFALRGRELVQCCPSAPSTLPSTASATW